MSKKLLSLVVPCYNEEEVLMQFYDESLNAIGGLTDELDYEMIFVDDGSADKTLDIIRELSAMDANVKYVSLSRNFGKEAAIYAGLNKSKGDFVVLLDADLQHPPKYIANMYNYLKDGDYDSVAMKRMDRKGEGKVRSFFSRKFYSVMKRLSGTDMPQGATDFRMMTRPFVDAVLSMTEYNRFTKGIFGWVGFNTKWIAYPNTERAGGQSKWSFSSLIRYSFDGIIAFSTKPLMAASVIGMLICAVAFLMLIWTVVKTVIWGDPVAGYPTLITVILMMSGLQLLFMGIIGQYFAKAYMELKKRPVYIVKEENKPLE